MGITKKITLGIPTYNEGKNVVKVIESIKNQNLESIRIDQIIFVDDSNDNTLEILKKLKLENPVLNIEIIHNAKRMGASRAWNTIFENSKYEIIVLLDADIEMEKNCINNLATKINERIGLCASNTIPIIEKKNVFSNASAFIALWLRAIRLYGLSQYTTMGRALALYAADVKELNIPDNIIAIDLYLQCKILEKGKDVIYDDEAMIFFKTPLNSKDFFSQVTRAIVGHEQIKEIVKKFDFEVPLFISVKEFIRSSIKFPRGCISLLYCYTMLPFNYFKTRKKVTYLWETANSTKV